MQRFGISFCNPQRLSNSSDDDESDSAYALMVRITDTSMTTDAYHYQGVLYKRRDVFTRQWRPRWFVLQPETGILTYYLFSKSDEPPSITMSNTPSSRRRRLEDDDESLSERRADSSSIQYDVVPRGTIYLRGCTVGVVDEGSVAADAYCFVITAPDQSTTCCLATRTEEARADWVQRLSLVCSAAASPDEHNVTADAAEQPLAISEASAVDEPEAPEVGGANDDDAASTSSRMASAEDAEENEKVVTETSSESNVGVGGDAVPDAVGVGEFGNGWKDLGTATAGLTPDMKNRIESVMKEYLPYVFENNKQQNWSLMFENKDGVTSHHREHHMTSQKENMMMMIKSVMPVMHHHPKQVFHLVADTKRRQEYETNIRYGERLKRCNAHTFIDYYAYNAVWPTMARDFLVLFHWRTMVRDGQRAILVMAFSYPCDDLKPPTANHVRGDLAISLFWLEQQSRNGNNDTTTSATRLLSYSLCGNIPQPLTNTIMQQQASLPYAISCYLDDKATSDPRLTQGEINNRVLVTDVMDRLLSDDGIDCVRRRLQFNGTTSGDDDDDDGWQMVEAESSETTEKKKKKNASMMPPSPLLLTIILLTPLVFYNITSGPNKEMVFLISALLAARTVVLLQLGSPFPQHDTTTGMVSCQFAVNLRGVLRLLARHRDDDGPELSVVPLVVKAIGTILNNDMMDALNSKQTSIPLLGLDGYFCRRENIHVSVLQKDDGGGSSHISTIKNASKLSNEQVATALSRAPTTRRTDTWWDKLLEVLGIQGQEEDLGSCLVVTSPDSDGRVVNVVQVAPGKRFNVVVAVGGVRMAKHVQYNMASPTPRKPPKPLLTMSVTIDCPAVGVADCRRFSEKLRELLEYPDDDDA